jgi:hypothetical protein
MTTTLDDLFSKDPLQMTSEDLDRIVETLRTQRNAFVKEAKAAKAAGRNIQHKMTREQAQGVLKGLELDL